MLKLVYRTVTGITLAITIAGCSTTPQVKYATGPSDDGTGYDFVIPSTAVKVQVSSPKDDKGAATGAPTLSFTAVPTITGPKGEDLKVYNIKDDSGFFSSTSTAITNVTYADRLIIQSIGTEVTDNRKAIIDTVFGLLVAGGVKVALAPPCDIAAFKQLVISDVTPTDFKKINQCWGYKIEEAKNQGDTKSGTIELGTDFPPTKSVSWFPIPACKSYRITVGRVSGNAIDANADSYTAVISASDGASYRRMPLSRKGQLAMHTDFCNADVTTSGNPISSQWDLVNQALTDVKNLRK